MTELVWETQEEIPRDQWGRPKVVPPGEDKAVGYTRCTTYVGALEDTYGLGKWQQRMVAAGLAARHDLLLQVNSLGPMPDDESLARRWKHAMDGACQAAMEAAGASAAATVGSALHLLTEQLDRGKEINVPPDYRTHMDNYRRATEKFTAVHIERFTVQDDLRIGGTPDRVLAIDGLPGLYIGDLKTGDTEYGVNKMAMQLAVYSRSQLYNFDTQERSSLGEVNTDRGLIIGLSAKTGEVEMFWVDLNAGWEAVVQLAGPVRAWRSRKDIKTPYVDNPAPFQLPANHRAVAALTNAIGMAVSVQELGDLWRTANAAGEWTDEHTQAAAVRKQYLAQAS